MMAVVNTIPTNAVTAFLFRSADTNPISGKLAPV